LERLEEVGLLLPLSLLPPSLLPLPLPPLDPPPLDAPSLLAVPPLLVAPSLEVPEDEGELPLSVLDWAPVEDEDSAFIAFFLDSDG
jgi:hypothetical protein